MNEINNIRWDKLNPLKIQMGLTKIFNLNSFVNHLNEEELKAEVLSLINKENTFLLEAKTLTFKKIIEPFIIREYENYNKKIELDFKDLLEPEAYFKFDLFYNAINLFYTADINPKLYLKTDYALKLEHKHFNIYIPPYIDPPEYTAEPDNIITATEVLFKKEKKPFKKIDVENDFKAPNDLFLGFSDNLNTFVIEPISQVAKQTFYKSNLIINDLRIMDTIQYINNFKNNNKEPIIYKEIYSSHLLKYILDFFKKLEPEYIKLEIKNHVLILSTKDFRVYLAPRIEED